MYAYLRLPITLQSLGLTPFISSLSIYSEMLLLFFVPQILNFLYSCPQVSKQLHLSRISTAFVDRAAIFAVLCRRCSSCRDSCIYNTSTTSGTVGNNLSYLRSRFGLRPPLVEHLWVNLVIKPSTPEVQGRIYESEFFHWTVNLDWDNRM